MILILTLCAACFGLVLGFCLGQEVGSRQWKRTAFAWRDASNEWRKAFEVASVRMRNSG
jgi:hypothetical protein